MFAIGTVNGSCANFIINNEIGYKCPSGDYNGLVDIIKNLSLSELERIGKNSREKFVTTLIRYLEEFAKISSTKIDQESHFSAKLLC